MMGRPRIEPGDKEFDGWDLLDEIIMWSTLEYCAGRLGMIDDTLNTRIKEKHGVTFSGYKAKRIEDAVKRKLREKQFTVAMSGNCTMLIWLGKQMLDQKETPEEDVKERNINITFNKVND